MSKVGLIALGSSLHDDEQLVALKRGIIEALNAASQVLVEEIDSVGRERESLQVILILTGGVERETLRVAAALEGPVILLAHPGHNSLPAALELLARLHADGRRATILYGNPTELAEQLAEQVQLADVWRRFAPARLGLLGQPSDWLVASGVSRERIRELGIELIGIGMEELLARIRALDGRDFAGDLQVLKAQAHGIGEPDDAALLGALRIYHALHGLVQEYRLDAFTIRCFDLVNELKNTGCYALSRLNDEGITAGCEGDLQALFSMHLARALTGAAAFMGNLAQIDRPSKTILLAHCTCPLSLAQNYTLRSHFESGLGLGIAAELPPGPATLFRLGGKDLNKLFIAEGEVQPHRPEEGLCRTQVLLNLKEFPEELLRRPLGNHHILMPGQHRAELEALFRNYLAE